MTVPYIVSHTRSGTHYLAKLLFENLECGVKDYEDLHFSHSRVPENGRSYIHLHRPIFPTMVSIWKAREHLGIRKDVTFSAMLRTAWPDMPRSTSGSAVFNGERDDRVCSPRPFEGTLLERWIQSVKLFSEAATLQVDYGTAVARPFYVLGMASSVFKLRQKPNFAPILGRVGWWAVSEEVPTVTVDDAYLLEECQCQFSR